VVEEKNAMLPVEVEVQVGLGLTLLVAAQVQQALLEQGGLECQLISQGYQQSMLLEAVVDVVTLVMLWQGQGAATEWEVLAARVQQQQEMGLPTQVLVVVGVAFRLTVMEHQVWELLAWLFLPSTSTPPAAPSRASTAPSSAPPGA
jgi:hypothetical protein